MCIETGMSAILVYVPCNHFFLPDVYVEKMKHYIIKI